MSCPQSQEKLSSVKTCQFLKFLFILFFSWSPISKYSWDVHWWNNLVASPFLNVHHNLRYCCWESMSLQAVLNYLLHANHQQHMTHPETAAACIWSWKWELLLLISFVQEPMFTERVDLDIAESCGVGAERQAYLCLHTDEVLRFQSSSFWSSFQCNVCIK